MCSLCNIDTGTPACSGVIYLSGTKFSTYFHTKCYMMIHELVASKHYTVAVSNTNLCNGSASLGGLSQKGRGAGGSRAARKSSSPATGFWFLCLSDFASIALQRTQSATQLQNRAHLDESFFVYALTAAELRSDETAAHTEVHDSHHKVWLRELPTVHIVKWKNTRTHKLLLSKHIPMCHTGSFHSLPAHFEAQAICMLKLEVKYCHWRTAIALRSAAVFF